MRLLGAGEGYFAYRVGFINSLFGNTTAATAVGGQNVTSQKICSNRIVIISVSSIRKV
jgi:hypothetical protein